MSKLFNHASQSFMLDDSFDEDTFLPENLVDKIDRIKRDVPETILLGTDDLDMDRGLERAQEDEASDDYSGEGYDSPPVTKRRRTGQNTSKKIIIEEESVEPVVKSKKNQAKRDLQDEIVAAYNAQMPEEEHVKRFTSLELYDVVSGYMESTSFKKKGWQNGTFRKVFTERLKQKSRYLDGRRTFDVQITTPALDSAEQYINVIANLFIEKYMKDPETGHYQFSVIAFKQLNEVLKNQVYDILRHRNVIGLDALADCLYIPTFTRQLVQEAPNLMRHGIASVTLNYDLEKL